ncbi:hypothetical protein A6770_22015 [Nostoc minutum NIES-26]|uniref:Uncharacterized protein n=1 Tax=Nostoc minutum NIES-26 TaxID=1844469 RepID=A0A367R0C8_9NOSO|nr:hypothetical protein A6770_22015 [Nostoc minutum NIES-26]
MSSELNIKVNNPGSLKTFIEKTYSVLTKINLVVQPQLKVLSDGQELFDTYLEDLVLCNTETDITVEIPEYAKVFISIFSAGESEFLGEEGGFWAYFEVGKMLCQSVFLMFILALTYAKLTGEKIVYESCILTSDRYISVDNVMNIIRISTRKDFTDYSIEVCRKLGIYCDVLG